MFKYWHIKKYGDNLANKLTKRYGVKPFYSASEIRATVYQCNFKPSYLPLAYLLYLEKSALEATLTKEFPELDLPSYKKEMLDYLGKKQYSGKLYQLKHS